MLVRFKHLSSVLRRLLLLLVVLLVILVAGLSLNRSTRSLSVTKFIRYVPESRSIITSSVTSSTSSVTSSTSSVTSSTSSVISSTSSVTNSTSSVTSSTLSVNSKLGLVDRYHYAPCVPRPRSNVTLDLSHQVRKRYPHCGSPEICCTNWTSFYQPLSSQPHGDNANVKSESRREPSSCLRLLLIVNFNSEFFGNIPVIEKLYGEVFTKIVYYSDVEHSDLGVHGVPFSHGVFQHIAVADAMHRYPDYDGYLWIGDDVFLNHALLFNKMNFSKVWVDVVDKAYLCLFAPASKYNLGHWRRNWGKAATEEAYPCLPTVYKNRFPERLNCHHCAINNAADVGYIPKRYRTQFMDLAFVFRHVLFEIAIPTFVRVMTDEADDVMTFQHSVYVWEDTWNKSAIVRQHWNTNVELMHPVKFSDPENLKMLIPWQMEVRKIHPTLPIDVCEG